MIRFRPHHFMCTLAFQGYGYSQSFVENYKKIASKVISDPNTKIEVVDNLDTICSVCPNQTNYPANNVANFSFLLDYFQESLVALLHEIPHLRPQG